jgi:protein O-mannosyl-transferase
MFFAPFWAEPGHNIVAVTSLGSWRLWIPVFGLIAFAATGFVLLRELRRARLYLFCAIWGAIAITPVLNLISFRPAALVEDRYLYMSSAAWCILVGALCSELMTERAAARRYVLAGVTALSVALAIRLWMGQQFFTNDLAMFSRCVHDVPSSWLCREWLGGALLSKGDLIDADEQLSAAIPLDPGPEEAKFELGEVHFEEGDQRQGLEEMLQTLRTAPAPEPRRYMELLHAATQSNHLDIAQQTVALADKHSVTNATAVVGRAMLALAKNDQPGAMAILQSATRKFPDDGDAWILLADIESEKGHLPEARTAAKEAVETTPNAAWFRMVYAKLLDRSGEHDEAVAQYREALAVAPNDKQIAQTVAKEAPEAMQ